MKEGLRGKHYVSENCSDDVAQRTVNETLRQEYMLLFEGGTFLLRETMLRSRDVIHTGSASFWSMIHVLVSVIIPVLKKKALLFDSPLYFLKIQKFPKYLARELIYHVNIMLNWELSSLYLLTRLNIYLFNYIK